MFHFYFLIFFHYSTLPNLIIHLPHDVIIFVSDSDIINYDSVKMIPVFINVNVIQVMNQGGTLEINLNSDSTFAVIEFIDSNLLHSQ